MTRSKRAGLAASVVLLAAALVGLRQLDAPLILYPASASLPEGLYFQTFGDIEIGKIAAFPVPEAARHYQAQRGSQSPKDFLFMKPVVAGPGDQVCNSAAGLFLNGKRWIGAESHDVRVDSPPVWRGCRPLNNDEFFMLSGYAPNSFDSRYFGPVKADNVVGVYQLIF